MDNDKVNTNEKKKYNPPKEYLHPLVSKLVNWVESLNSRFSIAGDKPIFDNDQFSWVSEVESEWEKIRQELDGVMQNRESLPNFHDIMPQVDTITQDSNWKTFFLAGYGIESEENSKRCPETTRILKKIPGLKTAFFSILSPHKHIPAHKGPYNGVLRYHLGLIVPEPREKCRIRIDDQYYAWSEGQGIVFDDTYNHEVWNDTDGYRVVLFVDFVRPVRFPFNLLNELLLRIAALAPFLKEAEQKHKQWEKGFYKN